MTLRVGLTLSVSSINFRGITPNLIEKGFKRLLTQNSDAIITQSEMYIIVKEVEDISP